MRWDQTTTADVDRDGIPDLIALRSTSNGFGTDVVLTAYRTRLADPFSGIIDTGTPFLTYNLGRTHDSVSAPRQRGHLILRDVDGDGLQDVLLRSTLAAANEYSGSQVRLLRGQRDPSRGGQDWQRFGAVLTTLDFGLGAGEVPHVHFALADLNFDGIDDLYAIHERGATPVAAIVKSRPGWIWQKFATTPTAADFPFAGTLQTGSATVLAPAKVERTGDLIVDVDPSAGIAYLPATSDEGAADGGFAPLRRIALQTPLPSPVRQVRAAPAGSSSEDLLVLLVDGTIGTLALDRVTGRYVFRAEVTTLPGVIEIHPAVFDSDRRIDCVAWDGSAQLYLLATVDASGAHQQSLALRATLSLAAAPERILVVNSDNDELSEVIVVMPPPVGETTREVRVWKVQRANGTGTPYFRDVGYSLSTTVDAHLTSLTAANLQGRHRVDNENRKWLIGGTDDGRILFFERRQSGDLGPGLTRTGVGNVGSGPVQVLAADLTADHIPDLVAMAAGAREARIFRNRPDGSQPFRFPNPGAWQFQGSGDFDSPIVVALPEKMSMMTTALVNDDPFPDLIFLSEDRQRIHVFVMKSAQVRP